MSDFSSPAKQGDSLFGEGYRVVISSPAHPWDGYTGHLVAPPHGAPFNWIVALDNGMNAAVQEREIRRV